MMKAIAKVRIVIKLNLRKSANMSQNRRKKNKRVRSKRKMKL